MTAAGLPPGCRPISNTAGACEPLPGYCARSDGAILRRRPNGQWTPLKQWRHTGGLPFCRIALQDGRVRELSVARLILRAFHGPRPLGCEAFWWPDSDRNNCRADNLRWAPRGTSRLGRAPTVRHVTSPGEGNPQAVLTAPKVRWARRQYRLGRTARSIAVELEVSETAARRAISGFTWGHLTGRDGPVKLRPRGAPVGNANRARKEPIER